MQLRYRFRIDPTTGQRIALARAFGCARTVYNDGLRLCLDADERGERIPSVAALSRMVVTEAKRTPGRVWLGQVSAVVLQQAVRDLGTAWSNHFASRKGTRKGPKIEQPSFKSKKDRRDAIRFTANARFKITDDGRLRLPAIGDVKVVWSRRLPSDPSSVTVIKDLAGRYWASFVVVTDPAADLLPEADTDCGIDLGLKHFAVLDDGRKIDHPKWLRRAEKKLKKAQRQLSRKVKGSSNRDKARIKVARQHARVADARRDWQHKLSTRLIGENQAVYVETLGIHAMARTNKAKSVHDSGWAQFVSMLEYKAAKAGRLLIKVDRDFPSTQRCCACGHRTGPKGLPGLRIREWTCSNCQVHHDRDTNAGINIRTEGRRIRASLTQHHIPGDVPALTG
ncbi:RNA-guided endonuclease TnpB family protein [Kitasatospora sp. NPDC028055]|uniref:RNA-guided endonuclease InsQ/TnpB family protein n=1 Tax=Kitasatospora sp. NPDC028055 TaxID=3155653 RepID=UPI0033CAC8BB